MKILIACEESQVVTQEFRKIGHEAYSCDLLPTSGAHPEWHFQRDILGLLEFPWDMLIAFPPCTFLTVTGNSWFDISKYGTKALKRYKDREEAIKFFMALANAKIDKIAIENPVGIMSSVFRKPDQIIHPHMFGDPFEKRTCLWLKNLPPLFPTQIAPIPERVRYKSGCTMPKWYVDAAKLPAKERSIMRSKTFPGIAKAMALQWGT